MDKDKVYINGTAFPWTPEMDAGQEDVDRDAYTNLEGYTIRNRVRHDVKTLEFNIPYMSGSELHSLLALRDSVWFNCSFFDEMAWDMITVKMYCSSPKYHKTYIDKTNPNNNIYTDIQFSFIQE